MMSLRKFKFGWLLYAILLATFTLSFTRQVNAQSRLEIRCGTFNTTDTVPLPDFVGTYYYTTRIGVIDPEHIWEFGLMSRNGHTTLQAPFTPELAQHIVSPRLSPDGTKIVFKPLNSTEIVVWKIATGEVAQFTLPQDLVDYLMHPGRHNLTEFNKLVWSNSSELTLQYFPLDNGDISQPLLRIVFTVLEQPLSIFSQTELSTIDLQRLPTPVITPQVSVASPDGLYRANVQERTPGPYTRDLQIYDIKANRVVFEVKSSEEARILGDPVWSSDRSHIFYFERVPNGTKLVQLNVNEGFRRDTHLDTLLEKQFGTSTGVASTFPALLSKDGTNWGFGYVDQTTNEYYMIRYDIRSGEVIAVCDDQPTSGDWYPFWSPSNRFAGYWYSGVVKIYDFETGNRYLLPGTGFAGWIEENP